jgi:hypothetical protein
MSTLLGVVAATAAITTAAISPAVAHADGLLAVGMELNMGHAKTCSVGFFATDSVGDQLAITAGHCASGIHELVYNHWDQQIGEVVSWVPDVEDSNGNLTGSRGFTVIYTYKTFGIQALFTGIGTAKVGDNVRLYGQTTTGTNGHITDVSIGNSPDMDWIKSDLVQLPGDSGGAWLTGPGDVLLGIGSSGNEKLGGGGQGAFAQPINSVEKEIMRAARYGQGFSVYII